ncbi:hypothetical protein [Streptomyces cupreus]|uniref:hypothetical protein n=1 Tax=Streptomyces cupreus TaxID=2759956 RepID=UPI003AB980DB
MDAPACRQLVGSVAVSAGGRGGGLSLVLINGLHARNAASPAGLRLLAGIEEWPDKQRNLARYLFLHSAARTL